MNIILMIVNEFDRNKTKKEEKLYIESWDSPVWLSQISRRFMVVIEANLHCKITTSIIKTFLNCTIRYGDISDTPSPAFFYKFKCGTITVTYTDPYETSTVLCLTNQKN